MKQSRSNNLRVIQRRIDHLTARLACCADGMDLTYDKAELRALRWAIEQLSEPHPDVRALRRVECGLRDMILNHDLQLRSLHELTTALLPSDNSDLPTTEDISRAFREAFNSPGSTTGSTEPDPADGGL